MAVGLVSRTAEILYTSLQSLWQNLLRLAPGLLAALLVIAVGWLVGKIAGRIVSALVRVSRADRLVKRKGLSGALGGQNLSRVAKWLVKYYVIAVFAVQALFLVNSAMLSNFAQSAAPFVHMLFGAAVILVAAVLVTERVKQGIAQLDVPYARIAGGIAQFLAIYFVIVLLVELMGLETSILADVFKIAFTALAITIAVIVGVGFGLAFSPEARSMVDKLRGKKR